jgi:hypothetical protein
VAPAFELVAPDQRLGLVVLECRDLEPEEQELRVDHRPLLREAGDKRAALGVVHVGREPKVRVIDGAREGRLDALALLDRLA